MPNVPDHADDLQRFVRAASPAGDDQTLAHSRRRIIEVLRREGFIDDGDVGFVQTAAGPDHQLRRLRVGVGGTERGPVAALAGA